MTENQTIKDKLKAIIAYYNLNVRQFEKSKTELFGKPTTKYKDMNGKDIVTHSVEKNENEISRKL